MGNLPDKSICQDFSRRDQHSFDFLICEGGRGWSATHTMAPFTVMMLTGHFLLSWLIVGVIEIAETFMLTFFKDYVLFHTNDAELETKAGSLIGDWLVNDLLGILMALLLLRGLLAPGLLRSWMYAKKRPPFWYCVKLIVVAFFLVIPCIFPSWILPPECDLEVRQECTNAGLILEVTWESLVIVLLWAYFFRRPDDYRYLWKPHSMSDRKINYLFGFFLFFILFIGLQNAQPFWPLFRDNFGAEWIQVWIAEAIWALIVFLVLYIIEGYRDRPEEE